MTELPINFNWKCYICESEVTAQQDVYLDYSGWIYCSACGSEAKDKGVNLLQASWEKSKIIGLEGKGDD